MSDLADALDRWESWLASAHGVDFDHDTMYAIVTVNEAARLVADPDLEAMVDAICDEVGISRTGSTIEAAQRIFNAALGITEDTE